MESTRINITVLLIAIYSALIPLENVLTASFGGSINKYIGLMIMLIIALDVVRNKDCKLRISGMKPLLIFGCYAIMSIMWIAFERSNAYISMLINMLIFTIIFVQYPLSEAEFKFVKKSIIFVGIILSIVILGGGSAVSVNNVSGGRLTLVVGGLSIDNNNLALSLCIPILYSVVYALKRYERVVEKSFYIGSSFLMLLALLMTGSRGGLLALVAGVSVYLIYTEKGLRIRNVILGAVLVVVLGIIIQYFMTGGIAERFTIKSVIESGGTGRTEIWRNALKTFQDSTIFRTIFGYGYGSFPDTMKAFWGRYIAAHNDFIGMLLDLGVVGLLVFIELWISLFKYARNSAKYAEFALLTTMLIGCMSMELLVKKMFWLVVYMVIVPITRSDNLENR